MNGQRAVRRSAAALALLVLAGSVAVAGPASSGPAIRVVRDRLGIPHVFASTADDAAYGIGYAVGQDRLWQAEVYRRAGRGRLAELLGPSYVDADRFARLYGPTGAELRAQLEAMPARVRRGLSAYAEGLNRAMGEALSDPSATPLELAALGEAPRPWTAEDSVAVAVLMTGRFGAGGGNELRNAAMLADLQARLGEAEGRVAFEDLVPLDDPDSPTTVPSGVAATAATTTRVVAHAPHGAARLDVLEDAWRRAERALGLPKIGSNAWVVAGSRTDTGRPMLYGGPQMGQSVPQVALELGIHTGFADAYGMTFAGAGPGLAIGATPRHAWTITSGLSDVLDTYAEQLDPADPHRYRFGGEWREMACRVESIHVRGGADVDEPVCETVHGPVVAPAAASLRAGTTVAYTQRLSFAGDEASTVAALFGLMTAHNLRESERAVSRIAATFNVLYADARGHIAYWHAGRYPVRPAGYDPRLPVPGTGEAEWSGFLPFSDQPRAVDPQQGWLANWNNKPAPLWPNGDAAPWGALNQVSRLMDSLDRDGHVTALDMIAIARDAAEVELRATAFKALLLELVKPRDPVQEQAYRLVEAWGGFRRDDDGDGRYDDAAYAIFLAWLDSVRNVSFGPDAGRASPSVLWRVLRPGRVGLPAGHDWLAGRTAAAVATDAFEAATTLLQGRFGNAEPSTWRARVAMWRFEPTGLLRVEPIPYAERGTYQQAVSFVAGDRVVAYTAMAPGQSGLVSVGGPSPHADDQRLDYAAWRFKAVPVTAEQVQAESLTLLRPR